MKNIEPEIKKMDVTPEQAMAWLETNTKNRALRSALVKRYTRDMQAGLWELNGETIKLDIEGRLLDGQHRLRAVATSETTVKMFVATGLRPEVFHTIDMGRQRSPVDVFGIRGEVNAAALTAALRLLWLYDRFKGDFAAGKGYKEGITVSELEAVLEKHPKIRLYSTAFDNQEKRILQPSVRVLLNYLFSKINHAKAKEFFSKLSEGYDLGRDDPILRLRNLLLELKKTKTYLGQLQVLGLTILAWNAFLHGEKMTSLQWQNDDEFPKIAKS